MLSLKDRWVSQLRKNIPEKYNIYSSEAVVHFKWNQIKSNHLLGHKFTTFILIKKTRQLYIYFVAGELQDSSGCFHTSSPGSA